MEKNMKCPHCLIDFHSNWYDRNVSIHTDLYLEVRYTVCPSCEKITALTTIEHDNFYLVKDMMFFPKGFSRTPLPGFIDEKYASDYREACSVLSDSPKASAALSRRCLQNLLRDEVDVKHQNLNKEIDEAIASNKLSSELGEALDYIRQVGNFAAHPMKSTSSAEIIEVEPEEAEYCLEVLEEMFDYLFIRPKRLKEKKSKMNQKLQEAGKPLLK